MKNKNRRRGAWIASLALALGAGVNAVNAAEPDLAASPEEAFMHGSAPGTVVLAATPAPAGAEVATARQIAPAVAATDKSHSLTERALELLGVRYKRGGESASNGLDCSGLVRLVFRDTLGIDLPHQAAEMSRLGEPVAKSDLQPGDLLFFRTVKRTISHVGIYLGEGQFIHAPHKGAPVRVESLDNYWMKHFDSAKRVSE